MESSYIFNGQRHKLNSPLTLDMLPGNLWIRGLFYGLIIYLIHIFFSFGPKFLDLKRGGRRYLKRQWKEGIGYHFDPGNSQWMDHDIISPALIPLVLKVVFCIQMTWHLMTWTPVFCGAHTLSSDAQTSLQRNTPWNRQSVKEIGGCPLSIRGMTPNFSA